MPSWNTHLEIGSRLADKLNIVGEKHREFLLWSILPDINNGFVNHPHIVKAHEETHYNYGGDGPVNFYAENKSKIDKKEPIYLAYFVHLIADDIFNKDFYHRIKTTQYKDKPEEELVDLKHNDFWLYGTNFRHILDFSKEEAETLAKKANQIRSVDINSDDILEVVKIIELDEINDSVRNNQYILYDEAALDGLIEKVLEKV